MPPPRAASADTQQTPMQIAAAIEEYLASHGEAAVLEDGKVLFDMRSAQHTLSTEHDRCTLHLWSDEANVVRRVLAATPRNGALRLSTQRFGQAQPKLLELVSASTRRTPTTRDATRKNYVKLLDRVLERRFPEWKTHSFRTAMDLESSFGPAYARGSLVRGNQAWAVIGVNEDEAAATIDGMLTIGILWLHYCREHASGKRLYKGLRLIVPHGAASTTLARMAWLSEQAAQWELFEFDQKSEELTERDAADSGNLRTRLVHHPDADAASERFAAAIARVMSLVPEGDVARVARQLRNPAELAFLLHGVEFARARIGVSATSFAQTLEITVGAGAGANETLLTEKNEAALSDVLADFFARRKSDAPERTRDVLYRMSPERWLESVLRQDLAPLTRHLGPAPREDFTPSRDQYANEPDPDTIGNRASPALSPAGGVGAPDELESRVIPRLDPEHVYAQVPAIAGAGDRGMLDLLGVTADGRLAVIELKASDDMQLAMQGLDYWVRVRHHHRQHADAVTGLGEFQRHGYFRGVHLSPLDPRLYLVAPALHIHPATETVLRYISPRVEWHLLALDERWRSRVKVIWRKQSNTNRG